MLHRRQLLRASAALIAAPAIVSRANAQSKFDWKQFKGQSIEVNLVKSPLADLLQAHEKEFVELTGIKVGSEQIPEQQQRPKVAIEFASGRPSFDVCHVALHVQKKLIEKGHWMADLKPMIANGNMTSPDYDFADFGGPGVHAATAADGTMHSIPIKQDLWLTFYNKALFAERGLKFPATLDELFESSKALTDKNKGIYGFVGRGLKNANLPPYTSILLGWDQETISADGKTLLTDTPAAIAAADYYGKLMRETAPPGSIGFNWNESQTTFSQARASSYKNAELIKNSTFPKEWFDAALACLPIARSGLPEIVSVTEFRDTIGAALTNIIGGADAATEMKKATEAFKPILAKELA
jgi:multiple sugar transport system substrate-binding protein